MDCIDQRCACTHQLGLTLTPFASCRYYALKNEERERMLQERQRSAQAERRARAAKMHAQAQLKAAKAAAAEAEAEAHRQVLASKMSEKVRNNRRMVL